MRWLRAMGLLLVAGCGGSRPLASVMPPPTPAPTFAVDLHLHLSISQGAKPLFSGEPGRGPLASRGGAALTNQVGEEQLRAAGVQLALGTVWPPFELRPGRTALDEAVNQLYGLRELGRRRPGLAVVTSAAQVRQAIARGRIAIVPAVEGAEGIREVDDVDRLWMAGARSIGLMHFASSELGGAAKGQISRNLFGLKTDRLEQQGLTALGRAAVERMIDLGMVIDLAHASDALSNQVLDLTEARGVPVLNSHSASRALLSMERNISDALTARIASGGGLIGIPVNDRQAGDVPEAARWPGFIAGSCDEVVAHWLHLAKIAGPQAIALGSDFNGFITRHPPGGSCPNGLRHVGDLRDLWAALLAHGAPRAALDGMGERFLVLFEKVESKAKPAARLAARKVRRIDVDLFSAP